MLLLVIINFVTQRKCTFCIVFCLYKFVTESYNKKQNYSSNQNFDIHAATIEVQNSIRFSGSMNTVLLW